jgi:hypothetical protein
METYTARESVISHDTFEVRTFRTVSDDIEFPSKVTKL